MNAKGVLLRCACSAVDLIGKMPLLRLGQFCPVTSVFAGLEFFDPSSLSVEGLFPA